MRADGGDADPMHAQTCEKVLKARREQGMLMPQDAADAQVKMLTDMLANASG